MAILNTNLSNYQADEGFSPVPPGEYHVRVFDSSVVTTKGNGYQMLKVVYEILGPTHIGRKIFDSFMLTGPEKAVEIGGSRLKSLATHSGHHNPNYIQDSEELHGLEVIVRVKIKDDPGYEPQNSVTSFKSPNEGRSSAANFAAPAPAVAPAVVAPTMSAPAVAAPTKPATPVVPSFPAFQAAAAAPAASTKMPWD